MKEGDPYCGFMCGDMIERQQRIMQDLVDFAEYNPGFAQVMRLKLLKLVTDEITKYGIPQEEKEQQIAISQ